MVMENSNISLENKPKRLRPRAFAKSIASLPLRNSLLPEFDNHAQKVAAQLNLSFSSETSFEHAFVHIRERVDGCANCAMPFSLKLIFFGYCVTHRWTLWATLERGTPARIVPLSLLEAPQFTIAPDLSTARYGALSFKILWWDRMDLMQSVGPPDFERTKWADRTIMDAVKLQEVRPRGERCRAVSMERMLLAHDLDGEIRTISRDLRSNISIRSEPFWATRRILTGGLIAPILASGTIERTSKEKPLDPRGRGRPSKRDIVEEGFFYWLELRDSGELPGITAAKKTIAQLLAKLKELKFVDDTADPKTIKTHLEAQGYLVKCEGVPVRYQWVRERWEPALKGWKNRKKISIDLLSLSSLKQLLDVDDLANQ